MKFSKNKITFRCSASYIFKFRVSPLLDKLILGFCNSTEEKYKFISDKNSYTQYLSTPILASQHHNQPFRFCIILIIKNNLLQNLFWKRLFYIKQDKENLTPMYFFIGGLFYFQASFSANIFLLSNSSVANSFACFSFISIRVF